MFTFLSVIVAVFLYGGGNCAPAFAAGAAAATPGAVVKCLEDAGDSRTAGAQVVLSSCDGSADQHWSWAGSTLRINGLCLSSAEAMAALEPCGRPGEQWADKGAQLVSVQSGQCLTDPGGSTANGTPLDLEPCNGGAGQRLALPAPSSSAALTWVLVALAALLLIGLVFLLGMSSTQRRIGRMFATVRSWFPRRKPRLSPAVAALLADVATSRDAVFAVNHAGRGGAWWPFAAVVSTEDVTVWLAGVDVPPPTGAWRPVAGDVRAWAASRSDLAAARAESDAPGQGTLSQGTQSEICPVVLGILDEAVVVVDVAQAHGILVVEGDERLAQQVRASADAQLEGGEVMVRGQGAHPAAGRTHWTVDVDADGWITIHGRRMRFADTPGLAVLDSVLDEEPESEAGDLSSASVPGGEPAHPVEVDTEIEVVHAAETQAAQRDPAVELVPAPAPTTEPELKPVSEDIDADHEAPIHAVAVSAASTEPFAPSTESEPAADPDGEPEDEYEDDDMIDLRSIAVSAAQRPAETSLEH